MLFRIPGEGERGVGRIPIHIFSHCLLRPIIGGRLSTSKKAPKESKKTKQKKKGASQDPLRGPNLCAACPVLQLGKGGRGRVKDSVKPKKEERTKKKEKGTNPLHAA